MKDVIKDFQSSDAPQFKGKSDKKKKEMAIAAKLSKEENEDDNPVGKKKKKSNKDVINLTPKINESVYELYIPKEVEIDEKKSTQDRLGAYLVGTKVTVGGKKGEIDYVQHFSDHPKWPHTYKIIDLSGSGKNKPRKHLNGGNFISHNQIKEGVRIKSFSEFEEIDEVSKLPPHLAKFFDKNGDLKPEVAARIAKGRDKFNIKDVTPKGYGPKE
jgi:hypothetical protein